MQPETIKIDNTEYVRKDSVPKTTGEIRIVVLQRGWVAIGRFSQSGTQCRLENAYIIRRWGTKNGLGELATSGKLVNTELEKTPTIRFHELTVIQTIDCVEEKWNNLI